VRRRRRANADAFEFRKLAERKLGEMMTARKAAVGVATGGFRK
jgi:hypothetical protein